MAPATKIKICGVTRPDDAAMVAAAGADFVGLNFWPRSKRYLPAERGPAIAAAARAAGPVRIVGVFVNAPADEIAAIARETALDVIQLHGDETAADAVSLAMRTGCAIWKAIALASTDDIARLASWPTDAILLDAPTAGYGGSGKVFDWRLAQAARAAHPARQLVLAGGLGPDNVAAAIAAVSPWAVDVASGAEASPGIKDAAKVTAFLAAARGHRG